MHPALKLLFEESVAFHLTDGTPITGSIFIGATEFPPVEVLRGDPDAYTAEFNNWLDDVWHPEQEERRNQILCLFGNKKRYTDLCRAVERRQVVPFVGSGMCVASGMPTWDCLLHKIREFTTVSAADLGKLISASAFEEAADLLACTMNSNLLNERIEHNLRLDPADSIAGPVRLLPVIFPDLLVTTNLDNVLELHYARCGIPFMYALAGRELARYRQLKSPKERFLLKLHGDCRRFETRVLLKAEYDAAYAKGSQLRDELTLLYRMNNLLFLGCSLGPDRTVQLVSEVAQEDNNMPKHYAFLSVPARDSTRVAREEFLTKRGIYPIWYDGGHDESISALLAGLCGHLTAG
jgi:hypothetical protein